MTLVEWVRAAVRDMGTQKEAAQKTGIAYATLQRVLAGESALTLDRISKIAAAATGEPKAVLDRYLTTGIARDQDEHTPAAVPPSSGAMSVEAMDHGDDGRGHGVSPPPVRFVPLHDVTVSAGGGVNAVEAAEAVENLGFPEAWLRNKFGDVSGLRIVKVKGDSMTPTLNDDDLVMFDINRRQPVDGIFVLRVNDQLMVKRVHFPSTRRLLITSDNRDYERFDRMVDLEREDAVDLIGRVVWAGKSL
ncbi:LexA family transcriptional regulator [Sphingobium abikonense]|uniref:LexA family transcriptional regulator n=1 Tax=Sphingobium abikonense TaxID=86193 RepID=UPI003518C4E7